MAANNRFSMGVHALSLLAVEPDKTLTSEEIAAGIDTNPVVVRRILATLQAAGLVRSHKGPKGGSKLAEPAKKISLARIHQAVEKRPFLEVPYSTTGIKDARARKLAGALKDSFQTADAAITKQLQSITIAQIVKLTEKAKK